MIYTKMIHGKLIEPQPSDIEPWNSETFKFNDIDHIPISLPEYESTYIVTCWDTNCYVKVQPDGSYEVVDLHGSKIQTDKEYIIIRTKY